VLTILADGRSPLSADARHVMSVLADALATSFPDGSHMLEILTYPLAAALSNRSHVVAVATHGRASLAGNLALHMLVHGGEAAGTRGMTWGDRRIPLLLWVHFSHRTTPFGEG
jgi:hypothetical protein